MLLRILLQQVIGWPWYLLTHITAGPRSSPRPSRGWWDNSHFLPSSSLFRPDEFCRRPVILPPIQHPAHGCMFPFMILGLLGRRTNPHATPPKTPQRIGY